MADDRSDERQPLLSPPPTAPPPPYEASIATSESVQPIHLPPIGVDEQPPPYTPLPQGGMPMINCQVCQAMISIEGKQHLHVVKCSVCNEATPIKAPPPGKQYTRCPCNCLLICRSGAIRISCPRANCKRIINLGGGSNINVTVRNPHQARVTCAYCAQIFLFMTTNRALARCPHCRRVSSIGTPYARKRGTICLILALIFLGAGVGVTVGTMQIARSSGGIYVVWIGAFISGLLLLIRAIWLFTIRTSYYLIAQ